jgi:uncharacterized membrane protein YraQ (UPF0718 family)
VTIEPATTARADTLRVTTLDAAAPDASEVHRHRRRIPIGMEVVAVTLLVAAALRPVLAPYLHSRAFENGATVFVAICIQALPYLTLGVLLSGAIAAFLSPAAVARLLPSRPVLAVPMAAAAGAALPGCECGSIPIAGRLVERGATPAAALAFLLSAPAINPIVLVATSVAFPGHPVMVVARLSASLLTSVATALLWQHLGGPKWLAPPKIAHAHDTEGSKAQIFTGTALHDLVHAGGFLVIGAATAATLQTLIPHAWLSDVARSPVGAVVTMAALAFMLAICSQADAFVATGFSQFSLTARLVFLVVGPAVDVKLVVLQSATFGRRFAVRFAPLTMAVAIASALLVGRLLL